jgi:DNA invertase Pin-like site-specific DNA recombinase
MSGKRIGYIRVSTTDQNPDRQLDGIPLDKKFIDYASGTNTNRPNLNLLLDYVREDDIVVVHSMDRLARNVKDLLDLVNLLSGKKVEVQFIKENLVFNGKDSALSKLLLMIIGAVAEFEHALIRERQREGIEIAKKKGKYKVRSTKLTKEVKEKIVSGLQTRKSKSEIAKELFITLPSLYTYLKKMGIHDQYVKEWSRKAI